MGKYFIILFIFILTTIATSVRDIKPLTENDNNVNVNLNIKAKKGISKLFSLT